MSLRGIFNSGLFAMTTLTASINEQPFVPQQISRSGLFTESGIATTTVTIERKGASLALLETKPRGAAGTRITRDKRDAVTLEVPHIPAEASLTPDQLQNVRAFGSADEMEGVTQVRDELLMKMGNHLDLTLEYHRLGAIQGLVLDADGSTLFDLFDEFGVSQPAIVDLNLDAAWTAADGGRIRKQVRGIVRDIRDTLKGLTMQGVDAYCGDDFFDDLVDHPETRETYLNQQAANNLRENPDPFESFRYGGATFINYRGFGDCAIDSDKCQFVPKGVPEMFITRFAPAPWFSAVNTLGLPRYAMATLDPSGEKEIALEAQSNPICLCTRPASLFRAKIT